MRKFSEATQRNYIRHIAEFAKFLGRFPYTATADDVRRHYGLLARSPAKASTLARVRTLIAATTPQPAMAKQDNNSPSTASEKSPHPCPCCGGRMLIIEIFEPGTIPRHYRTPPASKITFNTS